MMNDQVNALELPDENEGFDVNDEIEVGDLSNVKEQRLLIPPTQNVLLEITKSGLEAFKEGAYKNISMTLKIVDGIESQIATEEGFETTTKYKNARLFARVCCYADPEIYTKDFFKNKQHLMELKRLMVACGRDITTTKVNDGLFVDMIGMQVMGNIGIEKGTDGYDDKNTVKYFKVADSSTLV